MSHSFPTRRCSDLIFIALVGLTVILFTRLPGGFLPQEDQGAVITVVQAPPGATRERTEEAVRQVKGFYNQQEVVTSVFVVRGFSFFGQGDRKSTRLNSSH